MKTITLSIDFETDWGGRAKTCYGIKQAMPAVLDMLERKGIKATIFVSGVCIEDNKDIIKRIIDCGHEIACHGFSHKSFADMSQDQIVSELRLWKDTLKKISWYEAVGFRAPQFRTSEALYRALKDEGFIYDSSVVPSKMPFRYNNKAAASEPYMLQDGLLEIPVSLIPIVRLPKGLLWANLMGPGLYKRLASLADESHVTMYMHPFDLLRTKPKAGHSPHVKAWYGFKAGESKKTLAKMIDYWIPRRKFVTLRELAAQSKDAKKQVR